MPKKRIVIEVGPNPGETEEAAESRVREELKSFVEEMFDGDDVSVLEPEE